MSPKFLLHLLLLHAIVIVPVKAQQPEPRERVDYVLSACQVVLTTDVDEPVTSKPAKRYKPHKDPYKRVTPGFALVEHYGERVVPDITAIKTVLLLPPRHGKIYAEYDDISKFQVYYFDSDPNYIGKDSAAFLAEFRGARYKIDLALTVVPTLDEYERISPPESDAPVCRPKLTKVPR